MKPKRTRDLPPDEEVAPERLFLAERLILIDGFDAVFVGALDVVRSEVDLAPGDVEFAAGRAKDAGQDFHHRRFARAVVADQPDDLVATDFQIDVLEGANNAEILLDVRPSAGHSPGRNFQSQ